MFCFRGGIFNSRFWLCCRWCDDYGLRQIGAVIFRFRLLGVFRLLGLGIVRGRKQQFVQQSVLRSRWLPQLPAEGEAALLPNKAAHPDRGACRLVLSDPGLEDF